MDSGEEGGTVEGLARDGECRRDERVALMLEKRYEAFISQKT